METHTHEIKIADSIKAEIERFARQYPGFERADYKGRLHEEIRIDLEGNKSITNGYHIYATMYYNVNGTDIPVFDWATNSLDLITRLNVKIARTFEIDLIPVENF